MRQLLTIYFNCDSQNGGYLQFHLFAKKIKPYVDEWFDFF